MWYDIDKVGLGKILSRRGTEFLVYELIQNGWDQNVTRVDVTLASEPNSEWAILTVEDNDPDGFRDLSDAWTLFAESAKKSSPELRGRFNLGEKMVLALCSEAEVISTSGGVRFDESSGRTLIDDRRSCGSLFRGRIRMSAEEVARCAIAVGRLIPPAGIVTTFNGRPLMGRNCIASTAVTLETEIADADGFLRRTRRKTNIRIFRPLPGETATLYELGIPVVETGDTYHVDIGQKVPIPFDRDNVPPAYLRAVRTAVLNAVHCELEDEQANSVWVRDAMTSRDITTDATRSVVEQRFGPRAVAYDPSDIEANKIAVINGYTVVHGRQMSKDEWSHVRQAGLILPAGQVTPSRSPTGELRQKLPQDQWTVAERALVAKFSRLAFRLIGRQIRFEIADISDRTSGGKLVGACYGDGAITINRAAHPTAWWEGVNEQNLHVLIHELAHHYELDHFSREYYIALSTLGARLALEVAAEPSLLA